MLDNKEEVISYVAYCILCEYYYIDSLLFRLFMVELGYDLDNQLVDFVIFVGIGNLVVVVVIEVRKGDGANQYGEAEGVKGMFYVDYIGYLLVNILEENVDINCWQFKYFVMKDG